MKRFSEMKRYGIFGGKAFYARGGFHDLIGHADDVATGEAEARRLADRYQSYNGIEWWQVVDLRTGEVCAESEGRALGGDDDNVEPYNMRISEGRLVHFPPLSWE